jgi:hypothetical protein
MLQRYLIAVMPACLASLFVFIGCNVVLAQNSDTLIEDVRPSTVDEWSFGLTSHDFQLPYAGKIEARIGGSREFSNEKLRLDIGATSDILKLEEIRRGKPNPLGDLAPQFKFLSLGAEFFTWTRLRANDNFKFPVEAVDYYFGVNAVSDIPTRLLGIKYKVSEVRLRIAHISAHIVDGDPSFTNPQQQYITYSRECADMMLTYLGEPPSRKERLYAGAVWIFHTIPDTLGVLTPYAGFDGEWQLLESFPLTLKLGYEARLNTELEPIGEHLARVGLKLGNYKSRGVLIEASYYSGRSPYGQHFSQREKFFSVGFAVDY